MSAFYVFLFFDVSSLSPNNVVTLSRNKDIILNKYKRIKIILRHNVSITLIEIHKCSPLLKMRQKCWGLVRHNVEVDNINQSCIF